MIEINIAAKKAIPVEEAPTLEQLIEVLHDGSLGVVEMKYADGDWRPLTLQAHNKHYIESRFGIENWAFRINKDKRVSYSRRALYKASTLSGTFVDALSWKLSYRPKELDKLKETAVITEWVSPLIASVVDKGVKVGHY